MMSYALHPWNNTPCESSRAPARGVLRCPRTVRAGLTLLMMISAAVAAGCTKSEELVVKTVEKSALNAEQIERDPLVLLPAGALVVTTVDVPRAWNTPVGERFGRWLEARVPLPVAAGFVPRRDLRRLTFGVHSLQGVDVVGVAEGTFDVAAIEATADGAETTPLGTPLVRVSYAGRVFYVSGNLGFAVLTPKVALFGNEAGLRRALDRLERGELSVELEPALAQFFRQPGAPLAVGADHQGAQALNVVFPGWPPLTGLRLARVLGDFRPPGTHFAGSLTYEKARQAEQSQLILTELARDAVALGTLGALLGVQSSGLELSSTAAQTSVQITGQLDAAWAHRLIDLLDTPPRHPSPSQPPAQAPPSTGEPAPPFAQPQPGQPQQAPPAASPVPRSGQGSVAPTGTPPATPPTASGNPAPSPLETRLPQVQP